jgi:hypothetical protein
VAARRGRVVVVRPGSCREELRRFGTTRPTRTEVASSADASERDLLDKLGELKLPFSS